MSQYDKLIRAGLLDPGDRRQAALEGLFALGAQIGRRGEARLSPTPPPMNLSGVMEGYRNSMQASLQRGALAKKLADDKNLRKMFTPQPVNEQVAQRSAQRIYEPARQEALSDYADSPLSGFDNDMSLEADGIPAIAQDAVTAALPAARQQTTVASALQGVPAYLRPFYSGMAAGGLGKEALTSIGSLIAQSAKPSTYSVAKTGTNSYGVVDSKTGKVSSIENSGSDAQFSGGFAAQSANEILRLSDKITNNTATPAERKIYSMAHSYLSRQRTEPRPQADGTTLFVQVPAMDLSGFPPAAPPTAPAAPGAPSAPGAPQVPASPAPTVRKVVGVKRPTPPTQGQVDSATFAARMNKATSVMNELERIHGSAAYLSQGQEMLDKVPGVGDFLQRKSMTAVQQRYRVSALNWMMATLRDESGAAISIAEAERQYDIYFPRPGESADVIEDKKTQRQILTNLMNERAGPATNYNKAIENISPKKPAPIVPAETADDLRKRYNLPPKVSK